MATIVREELWAHPGHPGMIVVTTNATIKFCGALVMGRGAALQAKQRIPGIDYECAYVVREATRSTWSYPPPNGEMALDAYNMECGFEGDDRYHGAGYYFQVVRPPNLQEERVGFGIFQTKVHFSQPSEVELIRRSVQTLALYAFHNPDTLIRMNYPGIGCGGLDRGQVELLLDQLPDNVTVCYR